MVDKFQTTIKNNRLLYYMLAFLLPIMSLAIIYSSVGIAPFGDKTLLTIDMHNQYVSFFSYFRNVLHGEASLVYSFSQGLGGEMVGLAAYYLLSPFNLLFYFSDASNLPAFILFITALKIGASGLTMFVYLENTKAESIALLGSVMYALMSYNIVYKQNLMWLDAIIFLPLIISGLDQIIKGKKSKRYIVSLSLTIISQYYIAYMVCVFVTLYFIVKLFEKNWDGNIKSFWVTSRTSITYFIVESLLSGLISAIMIFPLIFSFSGGASEGKIKLGQLFSLERHFNFIDLISKFVIGSYSHDEIRAGLPNIYTSLITIPALVLFFSNKKIKLKEKTTFIILLVIMLISFNVEGLNILWHAVTSPAWFPYRYSFVFIFLIISYSMTALNRLDKKQLNLKKISMTLCISALIYFLLLVRTYLKDFEYLNNNLIILSGVLMFTYSLWLIGSVKKNKLIFQSLLVLIVIGELAINGISTLNKMNYASLSNYNDTVEKTKTINGLLPNDEVYRMEKTYSINRNDPLLFNYSGINHYSSSAKVQDKELLEHLGYRNHYNYWAIYADGSSIQADSLLGIKYIQTEQSYSYFKEVFNEMGVNVYHNQYALPIAFMPATNDVETDIDNSVDPLEFVNEIYNRLGSQGDVLRRIPNESIEVSLENIEQVGNDSNTNHYIKKNKDEPGFLRFNIPNPDKELIQFYFEASVLDGVDIFVNGVNIGSTLGTYDHTVDIASSTNDVINISLKLKNNELRYHTHYFYRQNTEQFVEITNQLQEKPLLIDEMRDGYLRGQIETEDNRHKLVLSIPYDENWTVKIDGVESNTRRIFGGFTLVDLPSNEKVTVEMTYSTRGLRAGIVISIIGVGLSILFVRYDYKRGKTL